MKASSIRGKIDALASKRIPFLFAVDFELSEGLLIEEPLRQKDVLFRVPTATNAALLSPRHFREKTFISHPEPFELYEKKFRIVRNALLRGDSFLVNLTTKTPVETSLGLKDIFVCSNAPYCLYVPDRFVCFSPERFVRVADGIISTNPMKGTINADVPDAERQILSNEKEMAEHNTIVDLLRNDLGMVSDNVKVKRFRYVEKIRSMQRDILQVSSEITGYLPEGYLSKLGSIVFQMLPAGSVSGAPKQSTLRVISRAEEGPRGFYTGVFGYFDGNVFDSAVMIRFIELDNGKKYFRSGGGITVSSHAADEYNEVIEKIYLPFL